MRCLALAQAWRRTVGDVVFALASSTPALEQRLLSDGFKLVHLKTVPGSTEDGAETVCVARQQDARWVVADGYHFRTDYQKRIKDAGLSLLLMDDYGHAEHYWADYVLNQNLAASPQLYSDREPYTGLLIGERYVLLRQQFNQWKTWRRKIPAMGRNILVTLGGADPQNVTIKVIQSLARLCDVEIVVVAGGSNPHLELIRSTIGGLQSHQLVVDADNMPELMAWADVAVGAGGSTSWELAFMGLPSAVIVLAENQRNIALAFAREGIGVNLGQHEHLSSERLADIVYSLLADSTRREEMAVRGRKLIDGRGVRRVIAQMLKQRLCVRRARDEDCQLVWEWANDPVARSASFASDLIPWESHVRWYSSKSTDPNCFFYIGTNGSGAQLGLVRFESSGRDAVVSVNISARARGKGYGAALILRGSEQFFAESTADSVHAYIRPNNIRSVHAFENANFRDAGMVNLQGDEARHLILRRGGA